MKEYAVIIGVVVLVIIGGLWVANTRTVQAPDNGRACTMEAKLCPDGSAVGRTGPNCEFTPCPAVTATTTTGGGTVSTNSGVRGTVMLGPTCPVERVPPDPSCADKAYATAIAVYHANSSTPFVIGNSNTSGAFEFSLSPGSYTLKASGGLPAQAGATLPRCNETSVTVAKNSYATATISCDTGIR